MALPAIPDVSGMRVQAETPEPPVRVIDGEAIEIAPAAQNGGRVGKERYTGEVYLSGVRPIAAVHRVFCFLAAKK